MSFFIRIGHAVKTTHQVSVSLRGGAGGKYLLKPMGSSEDSKMQDLWTRLQGAGYHGTTMRQLGEKQLSARQFESDEARPRIYFDDLQTATRYALRRADMDQSIPIVVQVASQQKPKTNSMTLEGYGVSCGLGLYDYFESHVAPIKIVATFTIQPLPA
ncbi:MAG: hypothetical protein KGZ39_01555 [Simkania sp.]|nr:hypothetical protein [Simkania sp.]